MDEQGNLTPTAMIEGDQMTGEVVEIPTCTRRTTSPPKRVSTWQAWRSARRNGSISSPLLPGKAVSFYWSVSPREATFAARSGCTCAS